MTICVMSDRLFVSMSRAHRLHKLLQELRLRPPPVTAAELAAATGVSERSVHRDIATLRENGAIIDGAAGFGFTLTEDPALPPMMFGRTEVEALVLGLREVQVRADPALAAAAETAMAKIRAVVPDRVQSYLEHAVLTAARFRPAPALLIDPAEIRAAAWAEEALDIDYADAAGQESQRRIWPLSIVFMDEALVLLAWCCLRSATRAFRLDRIRDVRRTSESFRPKRVPLLRQAIVDVRGT